jgi:hypothetical protein
MGWNPISPVATSATTGPEKVTPNQDKKSLAMNPALCFSACLSEPFQV